MTFGKLSTQEIQPFVHLALPDDSMPPTHPLQFVACDSVSVYIALNLGGPVFDITVGHPGALAAVPVPETTIDEEGYPVLGEKQVRRAGQVLSMQAKAIARAMKLAPDFQFRSGAFRLHSGHDATTVGPAYVVGHWDPLEISRRRYQQRTVAFDGADSFVVRFDKSNDVLGKVFLAEAAKLVDILADEGLYSKNANPFLRPS